MKKDYDWIMVKPKEVFCYCCAKPISKGYWYKFIEYRPLCSSCYKLEVKE